MTKHEFLQALERELTGLRAGERQDALRWFAEQIEDRMEEGMCEEEAVAALGDPALLARQIRESAEESTDSAAKNSSQPGDYTTDDLPKRIVLREKNVALALKPSPDGQLHLVYETSRYYPVNIFRQGDELCFQRREIFHLFHFDFRRRCTEVLIPADSAILLDLSTANASIQAERVSAPELTLTTSNASIKMAGLRADGALRAVSSNGSMRAASLSADALTLTTSNASIKVENSTAETAAELRTSNGSLEATCLQAQSITLTTSNAHAALLHTSAAQVSVKTSNGRINVAGLESAREILLHTSNGTISANLPGSIADYRITASGGGKSTIPTHKAKGERALTTITSNGRLDIHFAEDE